MGMLIFLGSEVMLFGGLLAGAMALRLRHSAEYQQASAEMHIWLGTANTAVLLTSSLAAALAVLFTRDGRARRAAMMLLSAVALALLFLGIKSFEYWSEYQEGMVPGLAGQGIHGPVQQLFLNFYYAATGLHAVHVTIGIGLMLWTVLAGWPRRANGALLVGNVALYWHLVDIVWIFLLPTIYLARP